MEINGNNPKINIIANIYENSPVGMRAWTNWSAAFQFGAWILRQVSHHRLFINIWISHFVRFDELTNAQPIISQAHGFSGILKSVFRIPSCPIGTQARCNIIDKCTNCLTIIPIYINSIKSIGL